jgi:hypothetical protein
VYEAKKIPGMPVRFYSLVTMDKEADIYLQSSLVSSLVAHSQFVVVRRLQEDLLSAVVSCLP